MSSRSLGTLTLDLITKIGGFSDGLGKAARITDSRAKEIERRAKSMGKAIGSSLAAGAGIAATGLGIYIKNTIEAEKVQAQLIARIRDTHGAAGRSLEQLNAQAAKLQNRTVFDDESIGEAQALLLTFKKIEGVNFDSATEAALDLSTAMGTDLNTAALQLGKALNDPIKGVGALAKAGVQFSADQKKVIKDLVDTGDVAGAQRVILKELEGQMGTAAEAARDTLGGALKALQNAANNALEGDSGDAGIKGLRQAVEDMTGTLNDPQTRDGISSLVEGLVRIANMAVQASSKIGQFGSDVANTFSSNPDLEFQAGAIKAYKQEIASRDKVFDPDTFLFGSNRLREKLKEMEAQYSKTQAAGLGRLLEQEARARAQIDRVAAGLGKSAETPNPNADEPDQPTGGGRGRSRARSEASMEPAYDFGAVLSESQARMKKQLDEVTAAQNESLGKWTELRAELEGPLAQAELEHIRRMEEIDLLGRKAGATAEEIAAAKAKETAAHQRNTEAIKEGIEVAKNPELIEALDNFRQIGYDFLVDLPRNGLDAWKNLLSDLEMMITQWAAKGIIDKLFGQAGSTGQGTGGGDLLNRFGGWLAGLFGGPMASGGSALPGTFYRVNERGPELLSVGGSDYLMMGSGAGRITPNHALQSGGTRVSQVFNQVINGAMTRRTAEQAARDNGRQARRGLARTGG